MDFESIGPGLHPAQRLKLEVTTKSAWFVAAQTQSSSL
jgi:hypothetical protein